MIMTKPHFGCDSHNKRVVNILTQQLAFNLFRSSIFGLMPKRPILLSVLLLMYGFGSGSIKAQSSDSASGRQLAGSKHENVSRSRIAEPVLERSVSNEIRHEKDKPTVYITFERAGKREPQLNGESDEGIWLRLHNNTRWSIKLDMNDVPSAELGDADLFYEVVADEKVVADLRCHACSTDSVRPGQSLLFSVPREYLGKGRAIQISFAYEWEEDDSRSTVGEPQHLVSFDSSKLPLGFLSAQRASN
ncbi:MAG TPA: hypothetical protein VLL54_20485 [Pyrinomonadaceae bacterium]|nr:hypothetical protein [Pyrinomonadaceae bacterium]